MSNEENYQTISLEERRKAILDALDDGKEISSADMEFLLDQLLNTSNINLGARGLENLNKILAGNMQESFNSVSNEFLNGAVKTTKQAYLGAETMSNPDIARDFGFKDLQDDLEKAKTKDDFYELIKNAQKRAIETRYNGTEPDNALANGLREAREGLKWHQFRRKRMAKKAEKDLDPSAYWSTKAADGNAVTSWYYGLRSRMAERKTNKGKSLSEKLQNNISNRKEYSELKWFSRDFRKKLGLRREIAFSRSPEKLMKKIMKKGNLEDVKNITDKEWLNGGSLKDAAKKLSDKKAAGYSMTKAELKTLEMYDAVLKDCKTTETYMNNLKNNKLGNVKLLKDPKTEALENKFKKKMQEKADQINKNAMETFKKSPTYKAYKKLNGGKEPKLENIVSGKDVFKKMLEENGYSQDQINDFMEQYYPEQDTVFREDEKDKKQEQQPEKENDSGKEATFGNSGYDPTKHIPILDDGKGNVQVFKSKDSKSYDACFKDEKGNNRFPTEEEYMKIAEAMKKDGWTKVKFNLDNLKPEQLKANLEVFEKAGLEITNKEDVMKAIAGYEKENPHAYGQEIGEERPQEAKKDEKVGEEKKTQETKKEVPTPAKEEITKAAKEGNTDRWTVNDAISLSQMKDKNKMMETDAFKRLPADVRKNILLLHDLENGTLKKKDGSEIKLTDKQKSTKMGECVGKIKNAHEKAFPKDKGEKRAPRTSTNANIIANALDAKRQNG